MVHALPQNVIATGKQLAFLTKSFEYLFPQYATPASFLAAFPPPVILHALYSSDLDEGPRLQADVLSACGTDGNLAKDLSMGAAIETLEGSLRYKLTTPERVFRTIKAEKWLQLLDLQSLFEWLYGPAMTEWLHSYFVDGTVTQDHPAFVFMTKVLTELVPELGLTPEQKLSVYRIIGAAKHLPHSTLLRIDELTCEYATSGTLMTGPRYFGIVTDEVLLTHVPPHVLYQLVRYVAARNGLTAMPSEFARLAARESKAAAGNPELASSPEAASPPNIPTLAPPPMAAAPAAEPAQETEEIQASAADGSVAETSGEDAAVQQNSGWVDQ